jgi:hypothetical protein
LEHFKHEDKTLDI